jgi:glyoxylase-like metal-dependent hydrolase (beta-lactamase superfamily II)
VIIIESKAVGPFFENGFVVACSRTREGVLIDPGDGVEGLLDSITRQQIRIRHILLTHAHIDHVTGVSAATRALNVPVHLHRDDLFLYERVAEQAQLFGVPLLEPLPPVDAFYAQGEVIACGDLDVTPHYTPGHCPGGVCLEVGARAKSADGAAPDLFVGDTLFAGSIGRTDLPGGDYATLMTSIRQVLFPFGDEARVYPGHGPMTTIGQERRTNPFLRNPPD